MLRMVRRRMHIRGDSSGWYVHLRYRNQINNVSKTHKPSKKMACAVRRVAQFSMKIVNLAKLAVFLNGARDGSGHIGVHITNVTWPRESQTTSARRIGPNSHSYLASSICAQII